MLTRTKLPLPFLEGFRGGSDKVHNKFLARLDAASTVADMDLPGFRLHPLKGEFRGLWAVTVRANWRVIFRFAERDVLDVDYLDYH